LGVGDGFEPVDDFAVEAFLDGDVGEGGGGSGAVPVLFVGGEPNDVAGADLLDGAAEALGPAEAGGDDEGLAEGVSVPVGARAGREGDGGSLDERGFGRGEERVDADGASEPVGGAGGGGLGAVAGDVHGEIVGQVGGALYVVRSTLFVEKYQLLAASF